MCMKHFRVSAFVLLGLLSAHPFASAGTITGNLNVKITIAPGCQVSDGAISGVDFGTLDFGTWSLLNQNIDAQQDIGSQVSLACSTGEPYTIALDDGQNFSSTRKMAFSGNYVSYELYQDPSRTQRWGIGAEALAAVGDGSVQSHIVYGRVPTQAVQPAGTYTDTVVVTVAW